jgi:hypothetical protein
VGLELGLSVQEDKCVGAVKLQLKVLVKYKVGIIIFSCSGNE